MERIIWCCQSVYSSTVYAITKKILFRFILFLMTKYINGDLSGAVIDYQYHSSLNMSTMIQCFTGGLLVYVAISGVLIIPPATKLGGVYWIHPVCLSVCPSVCLSVCPLTFRVRPVASTVQDGFFLYLVQMINSMRGCVACDDPWPWPISSRSFGLGLENRVRSVASTVVDGFFLYLAQMITIIRGCVAYYAFFRIWKLEFLANF